MGSAGHWRLDLVTELDIEVRAYNRSPGGFLTSIHEVAMVEEFDQVVVDILGLAPFRYYVPIFNPGSNLNQVSMLRLVNTERPGFGDRDPRHR